MPIPGPTELVLVLALVLIIFGPGKLPKVGAVIGNGLREFRRAAQDVEDQPSSENPSSTTSPSASADATDPQTSLGNRQR